MRAIPGRLMSLIVIGTRDSRPFVSTSSERVSRCCSKSWAMVICAVLIELKQSYPPVLQAIRDTDAPILPLRKDQDGLPALDQHADGLIHAERPRLCLRSHDPEPVPPPLHVLRTRDQSAFLAKRPAVLLLVVLHLLLAALQRAFLLLQHRVQRDPRIRILRLPRQVHTVSEYAE